MEAPAPLWPWLPVPVAPAAQFLPYGHRAHDQGFPQLNPCSRNVAYSFNHPPGSGSQGSCDHTQHQDQVRKWFPETPNSETNLLLTSSPEVPASHHRAPDLTALGSTAAVYQYVNPLDSSMQLTLAVPQSLGQEFRWGSAGSTSQGIPG